MPRTHQPPPVLYAKALQYLHNIGIVHRDVKPANVLLDKTLHAHLADFGLATYKKDLKCVSAENWKSTGKPTGGFHKRNMVGTLIYMAPEILRKDIHTEKSDIYSFAISINELLTGVVPYTDLRAEAQAHTVLEMTYTEQQLTTAVVSEGLRPVLAHPDSGAPPSLLSLIRKCWDPNPLSRPSFEEIVNELNIISKQVKKDSTPSLSSSLDNFETGKTDPVHYQESLNWFRQGEQLARRANSVSSNMTLWPSSFTDSSNYFPTLSWGSFATCGRRETMEDTHFMLPQIPAEALTEAFVKTDMAFRDELLLHRKSKKIIQKDWHPGCTAVTVLIVRNKLFVANAGDCRTILSRAGKPFAMSKDHVASCPDERARVVNDGIEVKWQVDTWRVGPAALQVTRSIGDDDLKPAVTARPEITETSLSADDEFLVMASDGLWDVLSNEDVLSIIKDTVKEPGMCSKRLATEAAERGSKDNITVIVVFLRPVSTAERIY
ncbi:Protein kinase and PP2C-like domain-containing protein [Ananas comosus]|uniref:protein-serine/threonine phosphatase n=1 Tax=Ananas comosus TaxID=4615 RepID=A0A199UY55_ANACO|nr:Protein kinase and PP2C-like domain-containing protein [Ananas comosus]